MQKQIMSILWVTGTCIGGGMIALPMVLAKCGLIASCVTMALVWALTYYTSLVSIELNLQSERGLSIDLLGQKFSGRKAETLGEISVKLLSYALLSVFLYGATSIIHNLIQSYLLFNIDRIYIETGIAAGLVFILFFPIKMVAKWNSIAFFLFAFLFLILIGIMMRFVDFRNIPWVVQPNIHNIISIVTVIFTSFGYQVIFHTLRDYCGKNTKMLRRTFFYGSFISLIVYMLWTGCVLSVIFRFEPEFFKKMITMEMEAGMLISCLSNIFNMPHLQVLVWWMSLLAIFTSLLGVGLGLMETFDLELKNRIASKHKRKVFASFLTTTPAYIIATGVPNAFIKILRFSGVLLVIIAIFLPIYLFLKANIQKPYLKELKKWPLLICCFVGIIIIGIEWIQST